MKIAINTLPLYKTKVGMGRYIVELINRVPKNDPNHEYLIYVSKENKKYFTTTKNLSKNILLKEVPTLFSRPFLKIFWEHIILPFSLVKNNISLYHAPGFVLPLWKPKKMKYAVTIADMTFFTHPQYHTWFKVKYFQALIPYSIQKADLILAISENTKKDIIALTNAKKEKIITTLLGIDSYFVPKQKKEYMPVLSTYGIAENGITKPYFLFVGMLEPRKNIVGLIKAFYMLNDKKGHILVIVGKKGWMYDEIFSYVKKLHLEDKILFTGYVSDNDLPALYSAATCFVYPSFYEGFGIPVIEAMACGCPVITSNNSSLKEIAGDTAILVDPKNTQQLAEEMQKFLLNKKMREEKKSAGPKQAKKYTWNIFAQKTTEAYKKIVMQQ